MNNELMPGAWIVEGTIAALMILLIGRVCGLQMTYSLPLIALAIGFGLITILRLFFEGRKPPKR
jgi:hypothetical protein